MDNPQQHAAQATANLVGRGELGRFTLHMVEVVEKDVATAVQDIRNNMGDDRVVGFDCEWRLVLDASWLVCGESDAGPS